MRSRAVLAAGAALPLLFLQCGGGSPAGGDESSVPLPDRVDPLDSGLRDVAPTPPPLDGNVDAPAPPACDVSKPFGAPARLAELDAVSHRSTPRLSADELTIYFTTAGAKTGADLSMALRASKSTPFGGETVLPQSGPLNDNDPSVTADHLSLWFHSGRNGTSDIFLAKRASTAGPFGAATLAATVNLPDSNEAHAYVRGSGTELWFVSDRAGGAGPGYDIFRAARNGDVIAAPTRVQELNSAANDFQPQPSEDGLIVLFASDRPGGLGATDLWIASRPNVNVPFGAPRPITELNSASTESAGWLSADRCRIWFGSNRSTANGGQQLFFAQRPK